MYFYFLFFFFFNDPATTEFYTLSYTTLFRSSRDRRLAPSLPLLVMRVGQAKIAIPVYARHARWRSEEHTSELQSLAYLVCRLLLEKKKLIISDRYDRALQKYDVVRTIYVRFS